MSRIPTQEEFERWVTENYFGAYMTEPPKNWNPEVEFFYLIEDKQYRIPFADARKKFGSIGILR